MGPTRKLSNAVTTTIAIGELVYSPRDECGPMDMHMHWKGS